MLGEVPWKKTGPSKRTWELGAEEQRLLGDVHLPSSWMQPVQGRQEGEERRAFPWEGHSSGQVALAPKLSFPILAATAFPPAQAKE